MNAITAHAPAGLPAESRAMLQMIRRGPFKDCNDQEFDEAISVARSLGLDPIRREIYAFVFNAKSQTRRNMVLVTSIMGYRKIAYRHGNYRPGPCRITIDREAINPKTNPRGIVSATATAFVHSHGEWHEITEEVSWESYAPIITKVWSRDVESLVDLKPEDWHLDPKKEAWIRQPDVMLKKCAEAQALRRGWPTDLSRLYIDEELDRSKLIDAEAVDITPSEVVAEAERQRRLDAIGGPSITVDPMDGSNGLIGVPAGKMADWVLDRIKALPPEHVAEFRERNRRGLQELWAHNKTDALEVKREIEAIIAKAPKPAKAAEEASTQPEIGEAMATEAKPEPEVTW